MTRTKPKSKVSVPPPTPRPPALYSVGTWDTDVQAYTPQAGLTVPSQNVPLSGLLAVLRTANTTTTIGPFWWNELTERRWTDDDNNDAGMFVEVVPE